MISSLLNKFSTLRVSYDPLTIFSVVFAFYSLFHMHYDQSNELAVRLPILLCASLVLFRPAVPLFLAALAAALLFEHWMGMPTGSNHTIMSFIFSAIILIAVCIQAVQKRGWPDDAQEIFSIIAPAGRVLLITMYFFGVFHKINTDFLNPDSSCASALVSFFIFFGPDTQIERSALYIASYGALIAETVILILLLVPRTRYWAVCAGVLFHFLIALSAYRNYIPFTLFCTALHMLFLDGSMLARLKGSLWWQAFRAPAFQSLRMGVLLYAAVMFAIYSKVAADELDPARSIVLWLTLGILLSLVILIYDYPGKGKSSSNTLGTPPTRTGRIQRGLYLGVTGLFFLSCFSPYIGLKSSQAIAMFSNLHVENGVSNHLIFKKQIPWFDNLNHSVEIVSVSDLNNPLINYPAPDVQMARYAFEDFMSRHPDLKVTYIIDGETKTLDGMTSEQIKAWTKNPIARKFMVFEPIYMKLPKTCFESFDRYRLEYRPDKNRWFKKSEAPTNDGASAEPDK